MVEFFRSLFATDFMAHRFCLSKPAVLWLHVVSDAGIAAAYYSIPLTLLYFVRKRKDLAFPRIFVLFALFILACGTTHWMNIITLWNPVYRFDGVLKLFTAAVSLLTAAVLIPMTPKALALPRPSDLERANQALAREIEERKEAEERVRAANQELEDRVRQRTADLTRSNRDLQQFAYIASHDLQEPLRMISSYTELLARRYQGKLDDDADEFIGYTLDGAKRMRSMVQSLLEYSRIDAQAQPFRVFPLRDAAQAALSHLRVAISDSGAEVQLDPLPEIQGDFDQLVSVFQNLIQNSIKYRGEDPPRIHIGLEAAFDSSLVVFVEDNGKGIPESERSRIFDLFARVRDAASEGQGIGLTICQRIIERHGGRIWVDPAQSTGARFLFTLPTPAAQTQTAG